MELDYPVLQIFVPVRVSRGTTTSGLPTRESRENKSANPGTLSPFRFKHLSKQSIKFCTKDNFSLKWSKSF